MTGRRAPAPSARYFHEEAARWASVYEAQTVGGHALRARRARLFDLLGDERGRLLDVGCGSAVLAPDLARRGWGYVGVDAAPGMIAHGRRELAAAGGHAAVADGRALPFADASFDAVICLGVLDRVAEQERAVAELVRVVRPSGVLVVSFPNRRSPYARWNSSVFRPAVGWLKAGHARWRGLPRPLDLASPALLHSPASATALLCRAGAQVDALRYFNLNVLLSPLDEVAPRLAVRLAVLLESLHARRATGWLGTGFLLRARRAPDS